MKQGLWSLFFLIFLKSTEHQSLCCNAMKERRLRKPSLPHSTHLSLSLPSSPSLFLNLLSLPLPPHLSLSPRPSPSLPHPTSLTLPLSSSLSPFSLPPWFLFVSMHQNSMAQNHAVLYRRPSSTNASSILWTLLPYI